MTLQEQLKQMAEFVGWQHIPMQFMDGTVLPIKMPPYNTSYDALMPVWVKYRDLQIDHPEYYKYWDAVYDYLAVESISSTFQALSDAITWYNSIK